MKLLREFLSWDCLLHAVAGAVAAFGLAFVVPWGAAVLAVTAFGFGRELWQSRKDFTGPGRLSPHRLAEALMWLLGAVLGVILWAVV